MKGWIKSKLIKKIAIIAVTIIALYLIIPDVMNKAGKKVGEIFASYKHVQEMSMPDIRSDDQKAQAAFEELVKIEEKNVENSPEWKEMIKIEKRRAALINIDERKLISEKKTADEALAAVNKRIGELEDRGK